MVEFVNGDFWTIYGPELLALKLAKPFTTPNAQKVDFCVAPATTKIQFLEKVRLCIVSWGDCPTHILLRTASWKNVDYDD